ncbi:MAG: siderophore-interacting protein [Pseudomonadota bacterium]
MTHRTETRFSHYDQQGLRRFWRSEFEEHGLKVTDTEDGSLYAEADFARVELHSVGNECRIIIDAPDETILPDIREGISHHMMEFAPDLPALSWSGDFEPGGRPASFALASVLNCEPLGASWFRITLQASPNALQRFAGENWHFRLLRPLDASRPAVWPVVNTRGTIDWPKGDDELTDRVFTTRYLDQGQGTLTFDIFRHEGGPTSDWAASNPAGQIVGLMGPGGKAGPASKPKNYLIAGGDETAVPAVLRGLSGLPASCDASITLLVGDESDRQPIPSGIRVNWLYRAKGATENKLVEAITSVKPPLDRDCQIWFAASKSAARQVRDHGRDVLALPRRAVFSTAYWS